MTNTVPDVAPVRNKTVRIFESSIEKLGRILSQKWNIRVVFKHGECKTTGSVIYLPVLPDNASQSLMDAMQGYLDHEAAHVIFTDFSSVQKLQKKDRKLFMTLNALEDPRVEKKMQEVWRGSAVNLTRAREWALQKLCATREFVDEEGNTTKSRPLDTISDFGKLLLAITTYGSVNFDMSHWFIADHLDDSVRERLKKCDDLIRAAVAADNTSEVLDISKVLLDRLCESLDNPPESESDNSDFEDAAEALPQRGRLQLSSDAEDDSDDAETSDASVSDSDASSEPSSPAQQQTPNSPPQDKPEAENIFKVSDTQLQKDEETLSLSEMLKQETEREFTGTDGYLVYTTEGDVIKKISSNDRVAYKKFLTATRSMVSVMRRKMSRSLLSTNVSRWEGDKVRGKINPRALFRVSLGTSKRVFRQKVEAEDFDTVVQIMVDHSGSMNGDKIDLAAKTALILGEICSQLSIPFSVIGFSTEESSISNKRYFATTKEEQKAYCRWGNHWISVYKDFNESWASSCAAIPHMPYHVKHNTYDGESLKFAAQRLHNRKEKRKILFWLNDGEPCPNSIDNARAHLEYAKLCAQEVEKKVELLAFGIGTDAVKDLYKNYVVVKKLQDLPSVCLNQLDALLRKGKSLKFSAG